MTTSDLTADTAAYALIESVGIALADAAFTVEADLAKAGRKAEIRPAADGAESVEIAAVLGPGEVTVTVALG